MTIGVSLLPHKLATFTAMESGTTTQAPVKYIAVFGTRWSLMFFVPLIVCTIVAIACIVAMIFIFVLKTTLTGEPLGKDHSPITYVAVLAVSLAIGVEQYFALRKFDNKNPTIKIAKEGLWTIRLGFVPWHLVEDIVFFDFTEKDPLWDGVKINDWHDVEMRNTFAHIYLKQNDGNGPDDTVMLGDSSNRQMYQYTFYSVRAGKV